MSSAKVLDDVLRFLSSSAAAKQVEDIAQQVACSLSLAAKALSVLVWLGFVTSNENGVVLDAKVRELVKDEIELGGY